LINEANGKSVKGDYEGALQSTQEALKVAKKIKDEKYLLRVTYVKFQCVKKMYQIPECHNEAINLISDILKTHIMDEFPGEMFLLYYYLADISISSKEFSTARAAIEKAESLSQDGYDVIRCEAVNGKMAMCEGRYDDAINLLKKIADTLSLKLVMKGYEDEEECYMIEQNIAVTLNDIAIVYRNKGDLSCAMIYVKKAVDAAEKEHLEYERAIFLDHWADMLIEDGLFDPAIEKAVAAQEIFKKRNDMSRFIHTCELLGAAYSKQENLTLSLKSYLDAFDAVERIEGKLFFSHKIAQLSAKLGDGKSLNKQIEFIRKFQVFDDDYLVSAFEKWAKDLQIECSYVLPDDFKDQPETFFMFDEENSDIAKWREELLEIERSSQDVAERDERVLAYLIQYSEEVSKQKKDKSNPEYSLKILRSKLSDSKSLSEKAQLMYEIGGWYYRQHNGEEADIWILKAMNAEGASNHTIIWSKITHAQVLMTRGTIEDDNEAKNFLDEVISLIETSKKYEAIAFCEFNRGRLEARQGNFKSALKLLKKAHKALDDGRIDNVALSEEIKEKYSDINQYLHFEDNPTGDLPFFQSEILFLQTWYPKYSKQLSEYWWRYRSNEPLNNIRISNLSACVIFSDDKDIIYWYSEALRFIFANCLFAPKESWNNMEHIVKRTIPVPCNTPFPYSRLMVNNKKIDGKVYGYHQQVGGSGQIYAYKQLQDNVFFDKNRNPEPITLSFLGYRYPDIISKIIPMVDELGSCRWWIGAEFGGSPDALMNLISRFGIFPVFHLNDVNEAKDITILRSERIDIPFITDNNNIKERMYLQAINE
jgi:tetratricopeptide (TPR) repeat protein